MPGSVSSVPSAAAAAAEARGGAGEGRDARCNIKGDTQRIEPAHLLGDGAV